MNVLVLRAGASRGEKAASAGAALIPEDTFLHVFMFISMDVTGELFQSDKAADA